MPAIISSDNESIDSEISEYLRRRNRFFYVSRKFVQKQRGASPASSQASISSQVSDGSMGTGRGALQAVDDLVSELLREQTFKSSKWPGDTKETESAEQECKNALSRVLKKVGHYKDEDFTHLDAVPFHESVVMLYDDMRLEFEAFISKIRTAEGDNSTYFMELHEKIVTFEQRLDSLHSKSPYYATGEVKKASATPQSVPEATGLYNSTAAENRSHGQGSINIDLTPRDHPLYQRAVLGPDGLYHCPWEGKPSCNHKPEKLKCNYDKFVDSHLKPYRCKVQSCEDARFSSTACLLRHEREAHAMHGHGEKPYVCTFEGCDRGLPGNGFPRHWNLCDHMRRVHNRPPSPVMGTAKRSKKRKNEK